MLITKQMSSVLLLNHNVYYRSLTYTKKYDNLDRYILMNQNLYVTNSKTTTQTNVLVSKQ